MATRFLVAGGSRTTPTRWLSTRGRWVPPSPGEGEEGVGRGVTARGAMATGFLEGLGMIFGKCGASLSPAQPGLGKDEDPRWIDIYEGEFDENQMSEWVGRRRIFRGGTGFEGLWGPLRGSTIERVWEGKWWERWVPASGYLCITVIQDPEPESKGGDVGLNLVSILPILSLIRSYAKVSLRGNNGRGAE